MVVCQQCESGCMEGILPKSDGSHSVTWNRGVEYEGALAKKAQGYENLVQNKIRRSDHFWHIENR